MNAYTRFLRNRLPLPASLFAAATLVACTASTPVVSPGDDGGVLRDGAPSPADAADAGPCIPPAQSCDQGSTPTMSPVDTVNGCILAPVQLSGVCVTSIDRCSPSAGISTGCAFAPDGTIYIGGPIDSDNNMLTASGWHFTVPALGFGPRDYPADEAATQAQGEACAKAACWTACPGAPAVHLFCPPGVPDAGGKDSGAPTTGAE